MTLAWACGLDDDESGLAIYFAATEDEAALICALEHGGGPDDRPEHVHRVEWADQYEKRGVVPASAWIENGYGSGCASCEKMLHECDRYVPHGDDVYCSKGCMRSDLASRKRYQKLRERTRAWLAKVAPTGVIDHVSIGKLGTCGDKHGHTGTASLRFDGFMCKVAACLACKHFMVHPSDVEKFKAITKRGRK